MNHLRSIKSIEQEITQEFEIFDTWMEKYEYLIDLGKQLDSFPDEWKTEDNKIHGCQSSVWFKTGLEDNLFTCSAVSDSAIVSGLIALLMRIYNKKDPREIIETEPSFISLIGLSEHLSTTRNNGLNLMIKRIKQDAGMIVANL
ncbi:MAG: SufE family protein [Gammaproteobacteria bacterium]|jgi:cysteine desulfuration protein SufE|nr:SufE family protein [Gammaproteobacteria bacterium]MBT5217541.1 SufE family protein [Gammaproteobacteria bacterium]MBT5541868.1 SufE family protein [Gammaproteobacteria bacterium]MBT6074652.1 SufE family protein [Gammaproteobacteria bacterium]MBT7753871.1 SufE family protein [Gammaproteobacteria bacterium]